jgi:hypothetical protein
MSVVAISVITKRVSEWELITTTTTFGVMSRGNKQANQNSECT